MSPAIHSHHSSFVDLGPKKGAEFHPVACVKTEHEGFDADRHVVTNFSYRMTYIGDYFTCWSSERMTPRWVLRVQFASSSRPQMVGRSDLKSDEMTDDEWRGPQEAIIEGYSSCVSKVLLMQASL
jgi:hypothetical protein